MMRYKKGLQPAPEISVRLFIEMFENYEQIFKKINRKKSKLHNFSYWLLSLRVVDLTMRLAKRRLEPWQLNDAFQPWKFLKKTAGRKAGLTPAEAETAAHYVQMREELQRSRKRPNKQSKNGLKVSDDWNLDQFQQESLILAQDERWRRA